ncbi:2-oxo-4-hydroxy-4-carboxy-5-ureidoimidazoline decarboxylase [Nocardioides iriomotensis]|uniref:2-oxo-4-hydroxy-4-carboxy-5-ureidoimidazoline decarboxylase n=1 Tax=Nocardioides iriomotensis TaxID=715784 RepID=A0A4Q5IUA7_9ACTN|nr:2-oxo-4-hydroxy-4-carboxy-5-ureidoimidazoline decarboxylase [Nocardioides iriomotensis]RYU09450.1 2-oxo-4-hydroxy-4-carboxy-5-ureidoimidazoline decarboxylase [Nocardioides iriomotensis]
MAQVVQPSDEQLRACCAADTWLRTMTSARPFPSVDAALALSDEVVLGLDAAGVDEALAAHARIGERRSGSSTEDRWSRTEQAGALAVDTDVQTRLAEANRRYEQRFGRVFLIRAAGRSAQEMLAALEERLHHDDDTELDVVRRELADIVRLRLEKVVSTGSTTRDGSTARGPA